MQLAKSAVEETERALPRFLGAGLATAVSSSPKDGDRCSADRAEHFYLGLPATLNPSRLQDTVKETQSWTPLQQEKGISLSDCCNGGEETALHAEQRSVPAIPGKWLGSQGTGRGQRTEVAERYRRVNGFWLTELAGFSPKEGEESSPAGWWGRGAWRSDVESGVFLQPLGETLAGLYQDGVGAQGRELLSYLAGTPAL